MHAYCYETISVIWVFIAVEMSSIRKHQAMKLSLPKKIHLQTSVFIVLSSWTWLQIQKVTLTLVIPLWTANNFGLYQALKTRNTDIHMAFWKLTDILYKLWARALETLMFRGCSAWLSLFLWLCVFPCLCLTFDFIWQPKARIKFRTEYNCTQK